MDRDWVSLTRYGVDGELKGVVLNRCCGCRRPLMVMSGWVWTQCGLALPIRRGAYGGLDGVILNRFCRCTRPRMLMDG